MQADLLTKVVLPIALILIMFGMSLSLRLADFRRVLDAPKALFIGLTGQLLLLPLTALAIATLFELAPEIAVGLMIIALAPGGATSNMLTYLAKGEVSLSISLTAVVSLITPFTIPLIVALSMKFFMDSSTDFELPILKTITQLLVITVVPVSVGMFVLSRWPRAARKMEKVLKIFSVLFLALIIGLIVARNIDNMASFFAQSGVATLVLNLVVLILGYQMANWARLSHAQAVCIGFEVGIQNGTLALVVAGTLIGNEAMMIPAVTYSLLMFVTGIGFGWWVNRKRTLQPDRLSA